MSKASVAISNSDSEAMGDHNGLPVRPSVPLHILHERYCPNQQGEVQLYITMSNEETYELFVCYEYINVF